MKYGLNLSLVMLTCPWVWGAVPPKEAAWRKPCLSWEGRSAPCDGRILPGCAVLCWILCLSRVPRLQPSRKGSGGRCGFLLLPAASPQVPRERQSEVLGKHPELQMACAGAAALFDPSELPFGGNTQDIRAQNWSMPLARLLPGATVFPPLL